ncbi:hypothetical protein DFH11DRAFT_487684 [Phellopilus nigrolimitatus]|nr:hypothetical protein DFH11DRAFT_487684 [Phellopilus nigrolimitatus]
MPVLQILHLDVAGLWELSAPSTKTYLPSITEFRVTNASDEFTQCGMDDMTEVMRALNMPNLENLQMNILYRDTSAFERCWEDLFFPREHTFDLLKSFSLFAIPYEDMEALRSPTAAIFRRFPTIQTFTLCIRDVVFKSIPFAHKGDAKALRSLHFHGCESLSPLHLRFIIAQLKENGVVLDELKLSSSMSFSKDSFEKITPTTRIDFKVPELSWYSL